MTDDERDAERAGTFVFLVAIICAGIGVGMLIGGGWGWITVAAVLAAWVALDGCRRHARRIKK